MSPTYENSIKSAQRQLSDARQALNAEIAAYPTPIAGCDAQFNHLLAERQKVLDALRALSETVFVPTPRTPTEHAGVESR